MKYLSDFLLRTFLTDWVSSSQLIMISINVKLLRSIRSKIKCKLIINSNLFYSKIIEIFPLTYSLKILSINNDKKLYFSQLLTTVDFSCCNDYNFINFPDIIIKYLSNATNLTVLNFAYCSGITDNGVKYIVENFKLLKILNLYYCTNITSNAFKNICTNELTTLNLGNCIEIKDCIIEYISGLSLLNLDISYCKITDIGIKYLFPIISLVSLNISGCKITKKVIEYISQLSSLTSINFSYCRNITTVGLITLNLPKLIFLDVTFCEIKYYEVEYILKNFKELDTLNIYYCGIRKQDIYNLKLKYKTNINIDIF